MNQIGCFVPAEEATLGLFSMLVWVEGVRDRIQTKFTALESYNRLRRVKNSVVDSNSSFTQDLTRIGWICKTLRNRSLVLVDEFGKETAPQGK